MKMHAQEDRTAVRGGTGEEQTFKIKTTALAMQILSDKLYSDKVRAVIRELAANAKDAMIDAGKGLIPFEIHLPNMIEPWFAVKDFGIGLSHPDVMNLYSTYFESTKTDSNEVTGCLGLGSKSPFAYVDAFTVEARWNGVLTLYSCFKDEKGMPTITVMGEPCETDEVNGIEIKMPVKSSDFREFAQKAAKELRRFVPTPIVTGNQDYQIKPVEYWVEGTGWKLMKDDNHYGYNSRIHAIQGNVTYPIDYSSLGTLSSAQSAIVSGLYLDIFFNLGELDVSASREMLGYDEATIANIKARLDVVAKELPPLFQGKFTDCKTLWEARILFKEFTKGLPRGVIALLSDNNVGLKWKDQSLSDAFKIEKAEFDIDIVSFERDRYGNRGRAHPFGYGGKMEFNAGDDILFFYDDLGHGSHSRMMYFLEGRREDTKKHNYLLKTDNKKLLKKLSKALGNVTLQPVSNLPKRPKAEQAEKRVTSRVLRYTGSAYDRKDSWEPTELDLSTGGIYVMISRFKVYDRKDANSDWYEVNDSRESVEQAKDNTIIDLTGKEIYGIRKGDVAKMKDDSGWVNLFDLIRDSIGEVIIKEKIAKKIADSNEYDRFNFDLSGYSDALNEHKYSKDSLLGGFMEIYEYMKDQQTDRIKSVRKVANRIGFTIEEATPTHDMEKLWEAVEAVYPMLALVDHSKINGGYYSYTHKPETTKKNLLNILQYVDDMDSIQVVEEDEKAA